jgi:glycosyltransferase involved in cell wall biosynthesis
VSVAVKTLRRSRALRVAAVFSELRPERAPLLDRVAAHPEIDLTAIYAERTGDGRNARPHPGHRAVFLRGLRLPVAQLARRYPLTLGIRRALASASPDVVVVSGWRAFATQAAIAWCRLTRIPYVLVVEELDGDAGGGWRRVVDGAVVTPIVQHAGGVLVTGTLARRSVLERGAPPEHVRVFADTIDVEDFGARADGLAGHREELRQALGAAPRDVVVLSTGPLAPEKRHADLVHAAARTGDDRLLLVLAGDGPERERLVDLARIRDVRLVVLAEQAWGPIELYAAADVFVLLSDHETWAVVVNEAAACGLPLVLSDRVGAAHDLLVDGENGALVETGDVDAAAAALGRLAADPKLRDAYGARSRELARDWGYGPSVDGFLAAVREADTARAAGRR